MKKASLSSLREKLRCFLIVECLRQDSWSADRSIVHIRFLFVARLLLFGTFKQDKVMENRIQAKKRMVCTTGRQSYYSCIPYTLHADASTLKPPRSSDFAPVPQP